VRNVLVLVSGLQDPAALAATVRAMARRDSVRIHLLSVQSPPSGHARLFLRGIDVARVQREDGLRELQPIREVLDAAGVSYQHHVQIGTQLATVARFAADRCCRRILLGDNKANLLKDLLLRYDCGRIRSAMSAFGFECTVVQREDATAPLAALGGTPA
jgi:hypothetical protein